MQSLQRVHTFKTIASTTDHFPKRVCLVIASDTCPYYSATTAVLSSVTKGIRSSQHGPYGCWYWCWCCIYLRRSILGYYPYYYILSVYPRSQNNNFRFAGGCSAFLAGQRTKVGPRTNQAPGRSNSSMSFAVIVKVAETCFGLFKGWSWKISIENTALRS